MWTTDAGARVLDDLDDDCQGFTQRTAEESENTVTRPT